MHQLFPNHLTGFVNTETDLGLKSRFQPIAVFLAEKHHASFDITPNQLIVFFLSQPETQQVNRKSFFGNFPGRLGFFWEFKRNFLFWSSFANQALTELRTNGIYEK